ncbi:hypothetical protein Vretifemale_14369, partial [Volvox reticuliferus]
HAAAAVRSRTQLRNCTAKELLDLPAVFAAAGVRMPATWAAQYVRHLASGLRGLGGMAPSASPDAARVEEESIDLAWRRGDRGLRRQHRITAPSAQLTFRQYGDGVGVDSSGDSTAENAGGMGQMAAKPESPGRGIVALHSAATALGWLPYIVPDLRYVAEYEVDTLQALARAFGLSLLPPQPLSGPSTSPPSQVPSPPPSMISGTPETTPATAAAPVSEGTGPALSVITPFRSRSSDGNLEKLTISRP